MNYKVYQGTELKQTVTSKTAVMNGLQPNKTYDFSVQPSDGTRDGKKATTFVTTRGIRFNIPKTLTVGSNITLRYEEYPLGIVTIGTEPSGMFGGGNKQNLSAKVISTANGSSVVEVAGNVIDVGGRNLFSVHDWNAKPNLVSSSVPYMNIQLEPNTEYTLTTNVILNSDGWSDVFFFKDDEIISSATNGVSSGIGRTLTTSSTGNVKVGVRHSLYDGISWIKLEPGSIATPYAAFVDGDMFTVQPDGTCALFSEHKALYY